MTEFIAKHLPVHHVDNNYLISAILGAEKFLFFLHFSMARSSVEIWGTEEQRKHWIPKLENFESIMTYGKEFVLIIQDFI